MFLLAAVACFFFLGDCIYVRIPNSAPIWYILMSLERRRFHFFITSPPRQYPKFD